VRFMRDVGTEGMPGRARLHPGPGLQARRVREDPPGPCRKIDIVEGVCKMRYVAILMVAFMVLSMSAVSGQEAIQDGDPLRLYLARSPTQDQTFLKFYKIFNETANDNPGYLLTLGPRGSGNESVEISFPTSHEDNSMKFVPNETVQASYDFSVLAKVTLGGLFGSKENFRVKVTVHIDYTRGERFDPNKEFSFFVEGPADGKLQRISGNLSIDAEDLKRTDPLKGGRLKVTISREDRIDADVLLYAGYRGSNCEFTLPMSRDTTVPEEEETSQTLFIIVVAGIGLLALIVYIIYSLKNKPQKTSSISKDGKKGSRSRRGKKK
jgi:hypothetical protein